MRGIRVKVPPAISIIRQTRWQICSDLGRWGMCHINWRQMSDVLRSDGEWWPQLPFVESSSHPSPVASSVIKIAMKSVKKCQGRRRVRKQRSSTFGRLTKTWFPVTLYRHTVCFECDHKTSWWQEFLALPCTCNEALHFLFSLWPMSQCRNSQSWKESKSLIELWLRKEGMFYRLGEGRHWQRLPPVTLRRQWWGKCIHSG